MTDGLPYGYLGIIAAMQFAVCFFWESKEEHWRQKNAGLPVELCHWEL